MNMNDLSDETPFVNEECGDTMWNDENLNPPAIKDRKPILLEYLITEAVQDSSTTK